MSIALDDDLAFAGPGALAAHVRAGELTARALTDFFLARIETHGGRLNAFREVLADEARAAADSFDALAPAEREGLALGGVPVAIKDDTHLAGHTTTYGSRSPAAVNSDDAAVVLRLRAAGAIPIAISNVPELMMNPWTITAANGVTRNPWDTSRTPGGSSGGSAAAVAAGLVPVASASDGAGSIRIPAACCGLVGMKPSRGRVSTLPAVDPWLGLSTYGALARTVADSALMLDVMQGGPGAPLPAGSCAAAAQAGARGEGAVSTPLRVALSSKVPPGILARVSPDQRLGLDRSARLLAELGHRVDEFDPPYGLASLELIQTYVRGISEDYDRLARPDLTEVTTRQMARIGATLVSDRRRAKLLARRPQTTARILTLWDAYDVLITPGLSRTAIAAEGQFGKSAVRALDTAARFTPFTALFNLTGQPAISLPAGFGSDGLPLSVQLVGRPGAEETLYAVAAQIEAARPWAEDRPAGF